VASKDPFNFIDSPAVAPIPCVECGNNMQCVRRQAVSDTERQTFVCAVCGHESERTLGAQESDHDIQSAVERSLGISRAAG
jgi:hypothetical protein